MFFVQPWVLVEISSVAECKLEVWIGFIDVRLWSRLSKSPPNVHMWMCVCVRERMCNCHLSPACRKGFKDFNWTPPVDAKCISPESHNPFNVPCILFKSTGFQNRRLETSITPYLMEGVLIHRLYTIKILNPCYEGFLMLLKACLLQ